MRISLYLLFSLLFAYFGYAQTTTREKTDALAARIQKHFNSRAYDSIYALGGENFKGQITGEKFREALQGLQGQLGKFSAYSYEALKDNVAKYKATFDSAIVALSLSVDAEDKLENFY